MNDNGRKPSSNQSGNEYPWWHSGAKCLAALLWIFTLAVAWRATFSYDGWTWPVVGALVFSLVLSFLVSCVAMASRKQ